MASLNLRITKNTKVTLQKSIIVHFKERRFMVYCDNNSKIIEWGSEEIIIPYKSPLDKKTHRYFPDFYVKYINKDKQIVREIIEVKPKKHLSPPKEPKRKTKRYLNEVATYIKNQKKFKS